MKWAELSRPEKLPQAKTMVIATLICDVTERVQMLRKIPRSSACILRTQKLAMEILGFLNMNKTERITYAFNMRAP